MSSETSEFATEPVPKSATVGWVRVCFISAMVSFSLPVFITGLEVANSVSRINTLQALLIGNLILAFIACFTGSIGARTHLSSYMLVRIAFGKRGATFVNLAFAVSLLGWFGVNIDLFGDAMLRLLLDVFDYSGRPWIVELTAGIVMTITTLYGFRAINILSSLLVPVLMLVTVVLITASLGFRSFSEIMAEPMIASLSLGDAISSVVGSAVIGVIILPDITRFMTWWPGAIITALLAYTVISFIVMGAGGIASIALVNTDLLDIMIIMGLGWAAFAIIIAGSWVLNSLNLYSTMLSVEATMPDINNRILIIALGIVGTGAAFLDILDYFLSFLFYLAVIFIPVAGVIIIDYFFVRRNAYHEDRIMLESKIAPKALIAWASGFIVALLGTEKLIHLTGIAAVDSILVAGLVYFISVKITIATPETVSIPNPEETEKDKP